MKVFIVFLGIMIVNAGFLVYQGDMNRYMRAQEFLKATAEECAAGAALYYEEDAFAEGRWVFKYEEGKKYAENLLKSVEKRMPLAQGSRISYKMDFEDDIQGYQKDKIPAVQVVLTVQTKDMFRLPFLKVETIKRETRYELPQA